MVDEKTQTEKTDDVKLKEMKERAREAAVKAGDKTAEKAEEPNDTVFLRLPSTMVMLTRDTERGERLFEGSVRLKYGDQKGQWMNMSYTDAMKFMAFMKENKDLVNSQLEIEEQRNSVGRL